MEVLIDKNNCFVSYEHNFVLPEQSQLIINEVLESKPEQRQIKIYNRICNQQRLVKLFGNENDFEYTYSRLTLKAVKYPENMNNLKLKLEDYLEQKLPICLANVYNDGQHYISPHSDDEKDLGSLPLIVSISLGAERDFVLQNKINKSKQIIRLENNSLLVMAGETQKHYIHSIPIDKKCKEMRVNLTFRSYKNE